MEKPFLTIDEQMDLLRNRGMFVPSEAKAILMREGYYSIVNGYKEPFIDVGASRDAGDDRYLAGTTFEDLYGLFAFDRRLREITFHYLIRAEATARTAVAYSFADAHRNHSDYLAQSSYCTREEFEAYGKDPSEHLNELNKLISTLARRRDKSTSEFIAHYRDRHGTVPIWVLCNDLTFGNIEHFFNLMKPVEKTAACKMIAMGTGRLGDKMLGYFGEDKARVCLEVLVRFRNICAHDERLYCARVGDRKNVNYVKMVWMLERFLSPNEFNEFLTEMLDLIDSYEIRSRSGSHLLAKIGFPELTAEFKRRVGASEVE